ncbi:MAG: hypothetical protein JSU72_11770 [Deltaproteobacteria bacterium]|nr:MAG: hypothetical protein JSU72_11770 [Deltaproteobacteria bacterium]
MNLEKVFCPNLDCPARGQCGRGNISVHSAKEKRCYCSVCQQTFSVTKGSIFYRLKTEPQMVLWVIALLAYGCPVQAIVVALGLDDRGIALCRPLLLAVDGLVSYVSAFQRAFRSPVPRWGQPGRCHLRP